MVNTLKQPGDKAPSFEYTDADGQTRSTADLPGGYLVYFYPKDNTPGCTAESCQLRDQWDDFLEAGVSVVGVSFDSDASHARFRKRHNIPFGLASDTSRRIATAFGVHDPKRLSHRLLPFARRVSFLVDKSHRIVKTYNSVNPIRHAAQVRKDIDLLLE